MRFGQPTSPGPVSTSWSTEKIPTRALPRTPNRSEPGAGKSDRSPLPRQPSPIDGQQVAVHVVGRGGRQKHDGPAEVLRAPPPPGRDALEDRGIAVRVFSQ